MQYDEVLAAELRGHADHQPLKASEPERSLRGAPGVLDIESEDSDGLEDECFNGPLTDISSDEEEM